MEFYSAMRSDAVLCGQVGRIGGLLDKLSDFAGLGAFARDNLPEFGELHRKALATRSPTCFGPAIGRTISL